MEIIFHDDGGGINIDLIRKKAEAAGIIRPDQNGLTDSDIAQLIFAPNFSTKKSSTSGRGIGLDAVKTYLEEYGHKIHLELLERLPGESL